MRDLKDFNILIVDDEEDLRAAIVFDFKRKGFNVFDAPNGKQAFEIVKNNKIDLVVTDVRMPGGDGVELLDRIKADNPELPVVMFITGFADITLEDAYDKGVDAVFEKPFDRKALFAAVIRALSNSDEKWGNRSTERVEADFHIDLNFPDLNLAIRGKVLNIGRGGIFVALKDNFPIIKARAHFHIMFADDSPHFEGNGIVRWVRKEALPERPTGCGIEFEFIDDQCRSQIIAVINSLKTKAFIPNT